MNTKRFTEKNLSDLYLSGKTNISEKDATALDARWNKLSEKLKDVEINDDLLITLSKYKFLDENGKL